MQQEELSLLNRIICVGEKMALEFGNDFCPPCEPIAWVWRERDDPIGCRPISVVDVVDVHLPKIHTISLHIDIVTTTHSASGIECGVTGNNMVSTRKNARSAHVEISTMERFKMREGKKESGAPRRHNGGDPEVYFCTHASTCLGFANSTSTSFSFLGDLPSSLDWLNCLACWFCMAFIGLTRE